MNNCKQKLISKAIWSIFENKLILSSNERISKFGLSAVFPLFNLNFQWKLGQHSNQNATGISNIVYLANKILCLWPCIKFCSLQLNFNLNQWNCYQPAFTDISLDNIVPTVFDTTHLYVFQWTSCRNEPASNAGK